MFLVPYGKVGRDFIDQLPIHINQWNNKSDKQHIALKAIFVLLVLGLQKPGQKWKVKDYKECFKKRLALWKDEQIYKLLKRENDSNPHWKGKEVRPSIQSKYFGQTCYRETNIFCDAFLNDDVCGGVLPITDYVMLHIQKHKKEKLEQFFMWANTRNTRKFIPSLKYTQK